MIFPIFLGAKPNLIIRTFVIVSVLKIMCLIVLLWNNWWWQQGRRFSQFNVVSCCSSFSGKFVAEMAAGGDVQCEEHYSRQGKYDYQAS